MKNILFIFLITATATNSVVGENTNNGVTTVKNIATGASYICSTSFTTCLNCGGGGGGLPTLARAIGQIATDSIGYIDYEPTMRINSKHSTHRYLKQNTNLLNNNVTLQNFNNTYNANNVNALETVEEALNTGSITAATNMNTAINTTNVVEANAKLFYSIYAKNKQGMYDSTDANSLLTLANGCPERDGLAVYQARVLYNSINEVYNLFDDNCTTGSSARAMQIDNDAVNSPIEISNSIEVYPNPSTNTFNINLKEANIEQATINVFDVNGKLVYHQNVTAIDKSIIEIDLNSKEGIYFLVLTDTVNDVLYKQKLIYQK
ncbi:MAG: T9SS type A sorting domain-containing protein [Ferruginibacter sp.]|nr:T9SS type A sorting domain-containing protein [Ferruginibacter sp.]